MAPSPSNEIVKDTQETLPEVKSIGGPSLYNTMIIKYFIRMGYLDLYTQFCSDLGIFCRADPLFMRRSKIRKYIEAGEIEKCVTELNNLDIGLLKDNKDIYVSLTIHKGYEMSFVAKKDETEIIKILEFTRSNLGDVSEKYENEIESFLEFVIFNSKEVGIQEKRIDMADKINNLILEAYDVEISELEMIVEEIGLEENELSKTNKFTEFKKIILD